MFDTLFAIDDEFKPHPQMVGDYSVSADKLTYSFNCATGSNSMTAARARASIASPRSNGGWRATRMGRRSPSTIDEMKGGDDKGFTIKLKEPFPC